MGWESRQGHKFYYRKKRIDGRVVSQYVGTGRLAEICAEGDELLRGIEKEKRNAERSTREAEAEIDRQLDAVESALAALVSAVLRSAGFHKHKGEWRKKRL